MTWYLFFLIYIWGLTRFFTSNLFHHVNHRDKSVFNINFASFTLLYAYPHCEFCIFRWDHIDGIMNLFNTLKWVSIKVHHKGLRYFSEFWYRFGYVINCFLFIIILTLILSTSITILLLLWYSKNEGLGHCNHSTMFWNDEFSRLSRHYEECQSV